ncbi:MAG: hypothetical protein J1F66_03530 [Clostridiales bacterium]|nr:hypothetical protein [Clostridiales bacterium]
MKLFDKVRLISDKAKYKIDGVKKGEIGTIIQSFLMFTDSKVGSFDVVFFPEAPNKDVYVSIDVCDLELVEESTMTDEEILEDLPMHDPSRYCKVVDGYIMNLKGEKLNKIPYQYDSWGEGYED